MDTYIYIYTYVWRKLGSLTEVVHHSPGISDTIQVPHQKHATLL